MLISDYFTEPAEMTYSRDIHGGEMDIESCLGRREVLTRPSLITQILTCTLIGCYSGGDG